MEPSVSVPKDLQITPLGESPPTVCDDCGRISRRVWGQLSEPGGAVFCVYYVHWTPESPDHDPAFDLILGRWGEGTTARDRVGVSLLYRASEGSFMVVDASTRPFFTDQDLFSRALDRSDVMGTSLAAAAFASVDTLWLKETRIEEITQW